MSYAASSELKQFLDIGFRYKIAKKENFCTWHLFPHLKRNFLLLNKSESLKNLKLRITRLVVLICHTEPLHLVVSNIIFRNLFVSFSYSGTLYQLLFFSWRHQNKKRDFCAYFCFCSNTVCFRLLHIFCYKPICNKK